MDYISPDTGLGILRRGREKKPICIYLLLGSLGSEKSLTQSSEDWQRPWQSRQGMVFGLSNKPVWISPMRPRDELWPPPAAPDPTGLRMFILALKYQDGLGLPGVSLPSPIWPSILPKHPISNTGETRMDKGEYLGKSRSIFGIGGYLEMRENNRRE